MKRSRANNGRCWGRWTTEKIQRRLQQRETSLATRTLAWDWSQRIHGVTVVFLFDGSNVHSTRREYRRRCNVSPRRTPRRDQSTERNIDQNQHTCFPSLHQRVQSYQFEKPGILVIFSGDLRAKSVFDAGQKLVEGHRPTLVGVEGHFPRDNFIHHHRQRPYICSLIHDSARCIRRRTCCQDVKQCLWIVHWTSKSTNSSCCNSSNDGRWRAI